MRMERINRHKRNSSVGEEHNNEEASKRERRDEQAGPSHVYCNVRKSGNQDLEESFKWQDCRETKKAPQSLPNYNSLLVMLGLRKQAVTV